MDVGGTFTDLLLVDERTGAIRAAKVPSTPDDSSRGVVAPIHVECRTTFVRFPHPGGRSSLYRARRGRDGCPASGRVEFRSPRGPALASDTTRRAPCRYRALTFGPVAGGTTRSRNRCCGERSPACPERPSRRRRRERDNAHEQRRRSPRRAARLLIVLRAGAELRARTDR
ncbi:MAG: hypothetical protein HY749_10410 [Gammaproteobacteria bacterium]|nr:hypothetical protein [Gammaproteobacteria bacterium]